MRVAGSRHSACSSRAPAPDIVTLPKKRSGVLPGPVSIIESSEA